MFMKSNAAAGLQKTYDDTYLTCSTAIYYESQGNEEEALRSWKNALAKITTYNAISRSSRSRQQTETEKTLCESLKSMELQCIERSELLEAMKMSRLQDAQDRNLVRAYNGGVSPPVPARPHEPPSYSQLAPVAPRPPHDPTITLPSPKLANNLLGAELKPIVQMKGKEKSRTPSPEKKSGFKTTMRGPSYTKKTKESTVKRPILQVQPGSDPAAAAKAASRAWSSTGRQDGPSVGRTLQDNSSATLGSIGSRGASSLNLAYNNSNVSLLSSPPPTSESHRPGITGTRHKPSAQYTPRTSTEEPSYPVAYPDPDQYRRPSYSEYEQDSSSPIDMNGGDDPYYGHMPVNQPFNQGMYELPPAHSPPPIPPAHDYFGGESSYRRDDPPMPPPRPPKPESISSPKTDKNKLPPVSRTRWGGQYEKQDTQRPISPATSLRPPSPLAPYDPAPRRQSETSRTPHSYHPNPLSSSLRPVSPAVKQTSKVPVSTTVRTSLERREPPHKTYNKPRKTSSPPLATSQDRKPSKQAAEKARTRKEKPGSTGSLPVLELAELAGSEADTPLSASIAADAMWKARVEAAMKNLDGGVDESAAKQIINEIVVQGDEVHWEDIAGLDVAKTALKEAVVYPFLRPDLFSGLREPARGMLLFGPPGTGKTMLARAVATESRSTFFSISASSLTSKYLGESEKLVRALFTLAKALAPSIIFVDEIDSLLSTRSGSGEHEATRRIKTEFLIQWSDLQRAAAGRETKHGEGDATRVLVLAATNLPWAIDEAARRRFVRRQYIPLPEGPTRIKHLRTLLGHQMHSLSERDLQRLETLTDGFSGSDITALAKDAAMGPLRSLGEALLHMRMDEIRPIAFIDFEASLKSIRPSVGKEGLKEYDDWAKQYGERV